MAWASNQPIAVGRPGPTFEPAAVQPQYRPVPYRPDTVVDGWSSGPLTVRAASLRGHFHRYNGAPRQDDMAVTLRDETGQLIVAVADGVSSASQSHIGSTIAVRYATQWLHASLATGAPSLIDWRGLVESTAWALVEQSDVLFSIHTSGDGDGNGHAAGSNGGVEVAQAEQLLATTLICGVVEPDPGGGATAHLVHVGDSAAWLLSGSSLARIAGGKPAAGEEGLISSAVTALPRVPLELDATSYRVEPGEVLLLGTDGIGDPLGGGSGEVGDLFVSLLGNGVPSLIEFAHHVDFSRETFDDDRTLVAVWVG